MYSLPNFEMEVIHLHNPPEADEIPYDTVWESR